VAIRCRYLPCVLIRQSKKFGKPTQKSRNRRQRCHLVSPWKSQFITVICGVRVIRLSRIRLLFTVLIWLASTCERSSIPQRVGSRITDTICRMSIKMQLDCSRWSPKITASTHGCFWHCLNIGHKRSLTQSGTQALRLISLYLTAFIPAFIGSFHTLRTCWMMDTIATGKVKLFPLSTSMEKSRTSIPGKTLEQWRCRFILPRFWMAKSTSELLGQMDLPKPIVNFSAILGLAIRPSCPAVWFSQSLFCPLGWAKPGLIPEVRTVLGETYGLGQRSILLLQCM